MAAIDWTHIYRKYKGLWVAMKDPQDTKVIASGKTLKGTIEKAERRGVKHPSVAQIPRRLLPIVGAF